MQLTQIFKSKKIEITINGTKTVSNLPYFNSKYYFFYLTHLGEIVVSDEKPEYNKKLEFMIDNTNNFAVIANYDGFVTIDQTKKIYKLKNDISSNDLLKLDISFEVKSNSIKSSYPDKYLKLIINENSFDVIVPDMFKDTIYVTMDIDGTIKVHNDEPYYDYDDQTYKSFENTIQIAVYNGKITKNLTNQYHEINVDYLDDSLCLGTVIIK